MIYLIIIVILGIIQVIGKALHMNYYFGSTNEFLFQPANEIFHVGAIIVNIYLYRVVKDRYKENKK